MPERKRSFLLRKLQKIKNLQKNEIRLYLTSHEEINSNKDKNLNVKLEILLIIRGQCKLYGSNAAYDFLGDVGMDRMM